jgi:hypothetical protein
VQGSILKKHRLNIVTETLIIVYERGCYRLFWLNISGDAIRAGTESLNPVYVAQEYDSSQWEAPKRDVAHHCKYEYKT